MAHTAKRNDRKLLVLCLLVVLLLAATAFGTMAWLTATGSVTNTFTVGNFNKPDTEKPNPNPEPQPGTDPSVKPTYSEDGFIVEPSWDATAEHKLVPGASFSKDPYVGLGPDSEDAIVYVYVENPFENQSVYFTLNTEYWEPVQGNDSKGTSFVAAGPEGEANSYVSGLFKYKGDNETDGILVSDKRPANENPGNVWTKAAVFNSVTVSDGAKTTDLNIEQDKNIVVSCFIHQAKDGDKEGASLATDAEAAAKEWAEGIRYPAEPEP